ncbi:hypothetical protein WR25_06536 [Diploscapter pachys]|uniref:Uncharacterized protein n=1 Tax=Diploscapter pachys TaxID=2018661 RepID=A0A2A2K845_9BILA|nr:hypothetical protein WR25_06536 [Diploscapter pachys]
MEEQYFFILLRSDSITFFPSSSCHFFACFVNAFFLDLPLQIIHFIPFLLSAKGKETSIGRNFVLTETCKNAKFSRVQCAYSCTEYNECIVQRKYTLLFMEVGGLNYPINSR